MIIFLTLKFQMLLRSLLLKVWTKDSNSKITWDLIRNAGFQAQLETNSTRICNSGPLYTIYFI